MTMFYADIDLEENLIRWVKAGHEPAILYTPEADTYELLAGEGLPLGVIEDAVYEEYQRPIDSGQVIMIGTDGIKEAVNARGEMFGNERLLQVIRNCARQTAREILDEVFASLDDFRHPQNRDDDETLVVIKIL